MNGPTLPDAPAGGGLAEGWYRRARVDRGVTVHRLTLSPQGARTSATACERVLRAPVRVVHVPNATICSTCGKRTGLSEAQVMEDYRKHRYLHGPPPEVSSAPAITRVNPVELIDPNVSLGLRPPDPHDPVLVCMTAPGYDLAAVLLAHRDDGSGHCRGCSEAQQGWSRYPCRLAELATQAALLAGRR